MDVFTVDQREQHIHTTTQLFRAVRTIHEVGNGFEFTLSNESGVIVEIGRFISGERLCCPFLEFSLKVASDREPISLTLTGPVGTQEFLRLESKEVFA